jgi:hypothetical protein
VPAERNTLGRVLGHCSLHCRQDTLCSPKRAINANSLPKTDYSQLLLCTETTMNLDVVGKSREQFWIKGIEEKIDIGKDWYASFEGVSYTSAEEEAQTHILAAWVPCRLIITLFKLVS